MTFGIAPMAVLVIIGLRRSDVLKILEGIRKDGKSNYILNKIK